MRYTATEWPVGQQELHPHAESVMRASEQRRSRPRDHFGHGLALALGALAPSAEARPLDPSHIPLHLDLDPFADRLAVAAVGPPATGCFSKLLRRGRGRNCRQRPRLAPYIYCQVVSCGAAESRCALAGPSTRSVEKVSRGARRGRQVHHWGSSAMPSCGSQLRALPSSLAPGGPAALQRGRVSLASRSPTPGPVGRHQLLMVCRSVISDQAKRIAVLCNQLLEPKPRLGGKQDLVSCRPSGCVRNNAKATSLAPIGRRI